MIKSYANKNTEAIHNGYRPKAFSAHLAQAAYIKLKLINAAAVIDDLRVPPGNHLESLKGKRKGQHSIRINSQWRICFTWKNGNAYDVEIVDYH